MKLTALFLFKLSTQSRLIATVSLVIFGCFGLATARADQCAECVGRKQAMCAAECRRVPADGALRCQNDCVRQYCAHRCTAEDILALKDLDLDCEPCLDQQFNLCETNCATGSDRLRASCKLECSKSRCTRVCDQETKK